MGAMKTEAVRNNVDVQELYGRRSIPAIPYMYDGPIMCLPYPFRELKKHPKNPSIRRQGSSKEPLTSLRD